MRSLLLLSERSPKAYSNPRPLVDGEVLKNLWVGDKCQPVNADSCEYGLAFQSYEAYHWIEEPFRRRFKR